jgi:hypothetical protein
MQGLLSILFGFATLLILMSLIPESRVNASSTTIYAFELKTTRGTTSNQPITVLEEQDQSGTAADSEAYLEFFPKRGYKGFFTFALPASTRANDVTELSLKVNYRGLARSKQRWLWKMENQCSNKWVTVGDNRKAIDWTWFAATIDLPGDPKCYINDDDQLNLRYSTTADTANSGIDFLALDVKTNGDDPPGDDPPADDSPPVPSGIWRPAPGTSWQWQLTGTIDTSIDAQMYDIDLFDAPQSKIDQLHDGGRVVICYFSAGSWEDWRPDAGQFPNTVKGSSNGWPGEKWLDIRQVDILGPIMEARLDLAVRKKCDGVEPDNVDGYTNNTGLPLTYQNQLVYLTWLAGEAHSRNLSIGLKNDLDQVDDLVTRFDWALNEQCFQYNECELLLPFVNSGKAVFGVEYRGSVDSFCPQANAMNFDWLKKGMNLNATRTPCR